MADNDDINANRAYQNAWIVYINGIEVPVYSVSVSYGVWQIPQAEIVMVPEPVLQRLGGNDRVSVQIFYCDQWIQPDNAQFRLLFDGEIVGWSYINVQRGRSISFTALDYIQVFTQLFFFFMSSVDDLAIGANNAAIGVSAAGVTTPGYGPLWPYSLFAQGVMPTNPAAPPTETNVTETTSTSNTTPNTKQDHENAAPQSATQSQPEDLVTAALITKPIDYVYNLVRGLLGNYPNASVPAVNFFGPWAQRTSFNKRFVALPYLEEGTDKGIFPILKAVQADWAVAAVARMTQSIGTSGSIYQVFQEILQALMMELAMLPTPPAVQTRLSDLKILGPATRSEVGKVVGLANYFVKPQFLFGVPPSCNVFFPSQVQQFAYQEDYMTQPTRMYFNDNSWTSFLNIQNSSPGLQASVRAALTVAHPEEVNIAMREVLTRPAAHGKNVLVYPEEYFRGPVVDRREMPRWFLFMQKAQDAPGTGIDNQTLSEEEQIKRARTLLPETDPSQGIFRVYAAYEYAKERYQRRNAGLSMAFNPYPVPGFPAAVFDRRSTRVDIVGYVMNVRHIMSSRNMTTDVSLSYARTFQEMFALMRKQIDTDNADIASKAPEVTQAIKDGKGGIKGMAASQNMQRTGPIAMGPAEIIPEIRDQIQNFQRAEEFYKALFYAEPSVHDDNATQEQAAEAARVTSDPNNPIPKVDVPYSTTDNDILPFLRQKKAAFKYNEIVQITPRGKTKRPKPVDIELAGIDQKAKQTLVAIIDKMRLGTATTDELIFVRDSLGRTTIDQQSTDTPNDPNITAGIDSLEDSIQNSLITTNIEGDVEFSPHPHAAQLFESYDAAMSYNARPICTLFEYVTFLGDRAFAEGEVKPSVALSTNDERVFPAPYYKRIRKYRAGPLPETPAKDYMNSAVITNADGVTVVPVSRSGEDFSSVAAGPPPAPVSDVVLQSEVETPAAAQPMTVVAPNRADTTQPGKTETAHVVQGTPADYAETSQDWDSILLEYRSNVLSRLSPGT